jgi:hypothetical protein
MILKKREGRKYSFIEYYEHYNFYLKEIGYSTNGIYELYLDDEDFIIDFHKHLEGYSFWT